MFTAFKEELLKANTQQSHSIMSPDKGKDYYRAAQYVFLLVTVTLPDETGLGVTLS